MARIELTPDGAQLARGLLEAFAPPPNLTVAQWAEQSRVIAIGNAEPGAWSNDRAPYLREIMEAMTDYTVHTLVVAGAAQSGKTAAAENLVGYASCCDPCTILWATPNDASAEAAALRSDAMIAATPDMRERFGTRSARSQTNNTGLKQFTGGRLVFGSAGSPTSLASHPVRVVVGDEIDRWPVSLRKEGDPVAIIRARTTTFSRGKALFLSSPTQEGASRIEALAAEGYAREWNWRCDCGHEFVLQWDAVQFPPSEPARAVYVTGCCGQAMGDAERWRAMARGRWVPTREGQPGVRSYRVRGLSSPWLRLALLASEFEQARGNVRKLAPFFNLRIGVAHEARGESTDAEIVRELAENYPVHVVPADAALLVGAVDVQGGWCAVLIAAVGDGDELWCLQFHEVMGDIKNPATRARIEEVLAQEFRHPSGDTMRVEVTACDAGYETTTVLDWSQRQRVQGRRFFATKGLAGWKRGIVERGADTHGSLARFFLIGIDQDKEQVMAGLAQAEPGPGKIHTRTEFPEHFWQWATAEELVTTETAGGVKREWAKKRGARCNEVLDLLVLCLAAPHLHKGIDIPARLERLRTTGSLRPKQASMAELAERAAALTKAA